MMRNRCLVANSAAAMSGMFPHNESPKAMDNALQLRGIWLIWFRTQPPPLARIEEVNATELGAVGRKHLQDLKNRRFGYPFTNCTNCGPRYTIVQDVPYDGPKTTMADFRMCPECEAGYHDPENGRFHAQPNACPRCGPAVALARSGSCFSSSADCGMADLSLSVMGDVRRLLKEVQSSP
jgi:ribosomal protein S27AE